jgi:hypothetical protein
MTTEKPKMRIVSDGTPWGTKVFDENGVEIKAHITAIDWSIRPGNAGVVTIQFHNVELDAVGEMKE